ncbi:MAG: hypothetical protein WC223_01515 [Bacteroidales bacterium]|jgi:hypothetical protein
MKKEYHYLVPNKKRIIEGYIWIYTPLVLLILLSKGISVIKFTVWYIVICGILFYLEYKETYFVIKDEKLLSRAFGKNGRSIPINNITLLSVGTSKMTPFQSLGIKINYTDINNNDNSFVLSFYQYKPKEIIKFVNDIYSINQKIIVDSSLINWIEKNTKNVKNEK